MANLKQIVKSDLRRFQPSPEILNDLDLYIQRAVIKLQRDDLLPPRVWEFTSLDKKEEKRIGDDLIYNFYYLPEDFRKLDDFRPYETFPYRWEPNEHNLFKDIRSNADDPDEDTIRRKFTIMDKNFDDDSGYDKILIAYPFPDDDETIRLKYYVNGKTLDWEWIDETHWEAVIATVREMVGVGSPEATEREVGETVSQWKEQKGHNLENDTFSRLQGSYFGKRRPRKRLKFNDGKRNND